jgi:beta-carotene ketolase (CrtO type)
VSSIDPRRLFSGLVAEADIPTAIRIEIDQIHSGIRNVAELKIDAVIDGKPPPVSVPGFERSFIVSANTLTDLERAFACISLGNLPQRPPLMMAVPSTLEPGWAPSGQNVLWVQTRVPWQPDGWSWDTGRLESAATKAWQTVERAFGHHLDIVKWRVTGPPQWLKRIGGTSGNPNHVDMSIDQLLDMRPSPNLSSYRTPIPGLYLTGAGTHPGGGISGLSGRNTARQILMDAHLVRRHTWQQIREQVALLRDALRAVRALRAS